MNKKQIAKRVSRFVIGTSVSFTASNVIANNVNPTTTFQKVQCVVGGVAIGMMAAKAAEEWSDETIEKIAASWNELKS